MIFSLLNIERIFHAKIIYVSLHLYFMFPLMPIFEFTDKGNYEGHFPTTSITSKVRELVVISFLN